MTRLWDRVLSRSTYWEGMYSGAYAVTTTDSSGRSREGTPAGIVRNARQAYADNGIVYACIAARMASFRKRRSFSSPRSTSTCSAIPVCGGWSTRGRTRPPVSCWPGWSRTTRLAGKSYIRRAQPADGTDALLVQMRPDTVTIVSEEVRDDRGRVFKRPTGYMEDLRVLGIEREPQFYDVDEVCHWSPYPDPMAQFRGMSWLTAGAAGGRRRPGDDPVQVLASGERRHAGPGGALQPEAVGQDG